MATIDEKKKYIYMENVLNKVNQKYVSLQDKEKKRNNKILKTVVEERLIAEMKKQNPLFEKMYNKLFFGGSYYDNLKVGNPEEFDLDVLFILPKALEIHMENSNKPGYVYVKAKDFSEFRKNEAFNKYPKLDRTLTEDGYFSTENIKSWFEGILTKVLPNIGIIKVQHDDREIPVIVDKVAKAGPAFTLKLKILDDTNSAIDVDLVPCFIFSEDKWPKGYKCNPSSEKKTFFVVPKKPPGDENKGKYWRLSFQEQERVIISGSDLKSLKPSLRLIKLLRDRMNHKGIASYYIKTIFMWEVEQKHDLSIWKNNLSLAFMTMLRKYEEYLRQGTIKYFWNPQHNLLNLSETTCKDFANAIKNFIDKIERNSHDPFIVIEYLLTDEEQENVKKEVVLGKKHIKNQQIAKSLMPLSTSKSSSIPLFDVNNPEHISKVLQHPEFKQLVKAFVCENFVDRFMVKDESPDTSQGTPPTQPVDQLLSLSSDDTTSESFDFIDLATDYFDNNNSSDNAAPLLLRGENEKLLCETDASETVNQVLNENKVLHLKYEELLAKYEREVEKQNLVSVKILNKIESMERNMQKISAEISSLSLKNRTSQIDNGRKSESVSSQDSRLVPMLRKYEEYLRQGTIKYFWNPQHNLLNLSETTCKDFANAIKNFIDKIERNSHDPFIVIEYLLTDEEQENVKKEVVLGKKHIKNQQIAKSLMPLSTSKSSSIPLFDVNNPEHISKVLQHPEFKQLVKAFVCENFVDRFMVKDESPDTSQGTPPTQPVDQLLSLSSDDTTSESFDFIDLATDYFDNNNSSDNAAPLLLRGENEKLLCETDASETVNQVLNENKALHLKYEELLAKYEREVEKQNLVSVKILNKIESMERNMQKISAEISSLSLKNRTSQIDNGRKSESVSSQDSRLVPVSSLESMLSNILTFDKNTANK